MSVILNHLHDWAHTQTGVGCTQCAAAITNAEIAANKLSNTPLDFHYIYKKAGH